MLEAVVNLTPKIHTQINEKSYNKVLKEAAMANVKPVLQGYHTITPAITVVDGAKAIEFYKQAFGAEEKFRLSEPGGRIGHAEIQIGDCRLMISDEYPELDVLGPESRGGTTAGLHLLVEDVDAVFSAAVAAGAKELKPVSDQFYGERSGKLADPFGHGVCLVQFLGRGYDELAVTSPAG